jgi:hypothetical protein
MSINKAIGTPGQKWGPHEHLLWLKNQFKQRSYIDEVVTKIDNLRSAYCVEVIGTPSYEMDHYKVYSITSLNWSSQKQTILITGGVHGYETSGVHGALSFMETSASRYLEHFNIICLPCVSPWGYETINRWTPNAVDPNRSFSNCPRTEESAIVTNYLDELVSRYAGMNIIAHFDLHETTDTDRTVFGPNLSARNGVENVDIEIPYGFYLVGNTANPQPEFQRAIIDAVSKVTHIALADKNNCIIDVPLDQTGVINIAVKDYVLCAGVTNATFVTTTEVYPDSVRATPAICVFAQSVVVSSGLDYILSL